MTFDDKCPAKFERMYVVVATTMVLWVTSAILSVAESGAPKARTPVEAEDFATTGWGLELKTSENIQTALERSASFKFEDIHLKKLLWDLRDSCKIDINIVYDPRVVAPSPSPSPSASAVTSDDQITSGVIHLAEQKNESLKNALDRIAKQLNLTCAVRGNVVWLSSSEQLARDLDVPLPTAPFVESPILELLAAPVIMEFGDTHIVEVLKHVQETFGINMVVDDQVIAPRIDVGQTAENDVSSYVSDGIIESFELKHVSLGEALFVLTRLRNLSYSVERNSIYVSTPERLAQGWRGNVGQPIGIGRPNPRRKLKDLSEPDYFCLSPGSPLFRKNIQ